MFLHKLHFKFFFCYNLTTEIILRTYIEQKSYYKKLRKKYYFVNMKTILFLNYLKLSKKN